MENCLERRLLPVHSRRTIPVDPLQGGDSNPCTFRVVPLFCCKRIIALVVR
jgi:hypothetical protein